MHVLARSGPLESGGRFLAAPDLVVSPDRPPEPLALAVVVGCGLAGADLFFAIASGRQSVDAPAILLAPLFAKALCLPPLVFASALLGQTSRLLSLAAVGLAGPAFAGVCLGAAARPASCSRASSASPAR